MHPKLQNSNQNSCVSLNFAQKSIFLRSKIEIQKICFRYIAVRNEAVLPKDKSGAINIDANKLGQADSKDRVYDELKKAARILNGNRTLPGIVYRSKVDPNDLAFLVLLDLVEIPASLYTFYIFLSR